MSTTHPMLPSLSCAVRTCIASAGLAALTTSCLAGHLKTRGTDHPSEGPLTRAELHAELGDPVRSIVYDHPIALGATPDYRAFTAYHQPTGRLEAVRELRLAEERHVKRVEVFRVEGQLADPSRAQSDWTIVAMTLGLAEVFDPFASLHAYFVYLPRHADDEVFLTYWLDANDAYVAHMHDDLGRNLGQDSGQD